MQSFSSRIWTRVAESISYDDNDYTTGTSPDDGPKSGRKFKGYIPLWTIHKSIPSEYDKSNTGIRTDPEENM